MKSHDWTERVTLTACLVIMWLLGWSYGVTF